VRVEDRFQQIGIAMMIMATVLAPLLNSIEQRISSQVRSSVNTWPNCSLHSWFLGVSDYSALPSLRAPLDQLGPTEAPTVTATGPTGLLSRGEVG
jgi:hypothetical protein